MTKKERIIELEQKVQDLELRILLLEANQISVPYIPPYVPPAPPYPSIPTYISDNTNICPYCHQPYHLCRGHSIS